MEAAYGFSITVTMLMTSVLLAYFLLFVKKWNTALVAFILMIFVVIEISFLVANLQKFNHGGSVAVLIGAVFFAVMYVWYFARKINNKFVRFVELKNYNTLLDNLSTDDEIPKFSTHLIYLTKANNPGHIEEKIIKSIFSKNPKRADVYWFLHINRTDEPYTLEYSVNELMNDKVIRVDINLGFKIQPRAELYFKKIVQELVAGRELNLHIRPDGSTRYNPEPGFKFVVLEKFLSVENEFSLSDGVLLNGYFFLKRLGTSDEKAFGLDKSDVVIEHIPLIYQPVENVYLERK
jgi:KUP system potassium uptake protein